MKSTLTMNSTAAKSAILKGESPDNLQVSGWLDLRGCTGLTALPDNLQVSGGLDLSGCTGLSRAIVRNSRKKFKVGK